MGKMEIVEIYKDWLYSIAFNEDDLSEYHKVFKQWHDLDYLIDFFVEHKEYVDTPFWREAGLDPNNPEFSAEKVINESYELESYIAKLVKNMEEDRKPDFDEYFHFLDGKFKCVWSLEPMKGYGISNPSLLRLYAIKIESNCYLIVCGGIKLGDKIQNSPILKDTVIKKIETVLNYLKQNGIADSEDF